MTKKVEYGTRVAFSAGPIKGGGKIVGIATEVFAELGCGYIVEIERSVPAIPNETYPYKCIVVFEKWFLGADDLEQDLAK